MSVPTVSANDVKLIVYACEAGVGSSLMGANQLKKLIKKAKLSISVVHAPVSQIPNEVDVIVTHKGLAAQAAAKHPEKPVVTFTMFINDPAVKALVATLADGEPITSS